MFLTAPPCKPSYGIDTVLFKGNNGNKITRKLDWFIHTERITTISKSTLTLAAAPADGASPGSSCWSICLRFPISLCLHDERVAQWHMSDTNAFISQGCSDRLIYTVTDAQKTHLHHHHHHHRSRHTRHDPLVHLLSLATCPNSWISTCLYEQTNVKSLLIRQSST